MPRDYRRQNEVDRFWSYVDRSGGPGACWLWTGGLTGSGYGIFCLTPLEVNGTWRTTGAHRYAYELLVGTIPLGLHLDHVKARGCRSTACVNPAHLEPVTVRVNTLRGVGPSAQNAVKTHCKHGHEFTPENTRIDPKTGNRACWTCRREVSARWNAKASASRKAVAS